MDSWKSSPSFDTFDQNEITRYSASNNKDIRSSCKLIKKFKEVVHGIERLQHILQSINHNRETGKNV